MSYRDLRDWIVRVDELGELKRIRRAHWHLEMSTITELTFREQRENPPAILFDNIVDYPRGYRALWGQTGSIRRLALTLGLPIQPHALGLVGALREKLRTLTPIPPKIVSWGPIFENVMEGEAVDLLRFPIPFVHELDGGRYIGTGVMVITRDPDEGWVNFGAYRVMVHDQRTVGFYISPGKHGRIHRDKYFARGEPCPVAIPVGQDNEMPFGSSEYDYAGGLKDEPIEVVEGRHTGLPIPAWSEIVLEGEAIPTDRRREGPFGEWAGYYGSGAREEPVIRVKAVYHRNQPILGCVRPGRPPFDYSLSKSVMKSALLWDDLEKAGCPNVRGVWCHDAGGGRLLNIIAIKQAYPGHAKQAAMLLAQCHAGAYLGRFAIVVDEDIDPTNTYDVLWALATRCDPASSIDILRRAWSGPLDPIIRPGQKGFNSRAVVEACRPYEWREEFPAVAEASPELKAQVMAKWGKLIQARPRPARTRSSGRRRSG
ncbi:MAG: UbiD family decarboxylase [Deltaproteobacteria bacterium]|nr:UbiD family decarboxylase [Deltaproteobacteria bacterium]